MNEGKGFIMQDETERKRREGKDNNFKWFHILADMREDFVLAYSPWHERRTALF